MNDVDLRTALHRDADLVGEPSPDLLDQLLQRRRHQNRQRAGVLAAVLGVVVIAAGIPVGTSLLAQSDSGPATETTVEVTPSITPEVTPTPATTPVPTPEVTPTPTPTAAVETEPAVPMLGPDGLGALKLGMSRAQAEATGLVGPFRNEPNSDRCLWRSALTGAPAGKGIVLHSETLGVATIDAYEGVRTPEGIAIGSSFAAVQSAYPDAEPMFPDFESSGHNGRVYTWARGSSQAVYRISFIDATVVQLTLQYANQDCYE